MRHAVIMAGGAGTRLWPLSRKNRPKQLLQVLEGQSLLRQSFERLRGLLPVEQIHVITGSEYVPAMRAELPELPAENFIAEPCARDTANAIGLAAHLLTARDPAAMMGVFTADHIVRPTDAFRATVAKGFDVAERFPDALVTFGVKPRMPHTGYGYIERGVRLEAGVYETEQFVEKPDPPTAERYFASSEYYWNSGMFVWRVGAIIEQIRKHQSAIDEGLRVVAAEFGDPAKADAVRERFAALPKVSVDFAVMERADRVITVEMACEWLDVGSWTSLTEIIPADADGHTRAASNVVSLRGKRNIYVSESDHLIATIGLSDLVVVHSEDATLICRRQDAQKIKDLVEKIRAIQGERYT
ncbi:MAG TPA: mannose-1-phosphate guanylyltransferase [Phycisphaerae bacterium]|nr:mannose-1-phosphate guanylyltransferase [Phycisphaerae bacterium]